MNRKQWQAAQKREILEIRKPQETCESAQSEGIAIKKQAKNWGLLGWWKRPKRVKCFDTGKQFVEIRQHGNCIEIAGLSQDGRNKHVGRFGKLTKRLKDMGFVWVRKAGERRVTGWVLDCRETGWNRKDWLTAVWVETRQYGLDKSDSEFMATSQAAKITQHMVGRYIGQNR